MTTTADRRVVREMSRRHKVEELEQHVREWQEEVDAMTQRKDEGERYILDYARRQLHKAKRELAEARV